MRKLNSWIVLSIGLAALTLAILVNSSPAVGAPTTSPTPVLVTNTPLPVSGTVSLGGIATVRVAPATPVAEFLGNYAGYPDTWTNNTGSAAVIDLVNGGSVDGVTIQLNVWANNGLYSHGYWFPTTADSTGNFMAHTLTKVPVPSGARVTVSGGAMIEIVGHLE